MFRLVVVLSLMAASLFSQPSGCHNSGDIGRIGISGVPPTETFYFCNKNEAGVIGWTAHGQLSWTKFSVAKVANAVSGCTSANGCWIVNGANPVVAAAALTQTISLHTLPINNPWVQAIRVKTTTACAGAATTTVTDFGTAAAITLFMTGATFDLKAAVSTSNFLYATMAANNPTTVGTATLAVKVTNTTNNISVITAGCAFDVHVLWAPLP